MGNVVNRVFDSSGPEGKVRGTPQQIIDKYNQLARDAQLSGDRVATENFQQHAEHYTRMLAEAQREMQERQDRQQQQNNNQHNNNNQQNNNQQGGQPDRDEGGQDNQNRNDAAQNDQPRQQGETQGGDKPRRGRRKPEPRDDEVIDTGDGDTGLVETPESAPKRSRRSRQKAETVETGAAQDAAE